MAAGSGAAAAVMGVAKKLPLARLAKWAVLLVLALWVVPVLVLLAVRAVTAVTDPWALVIDGIAPLIADGWLLALAVAVPIVLGLVWSRVHPRSWAPVRSRLFGSVRSVLVYRWRWSRLCRACGLSKKNPRTGDDEVARLVRVRLSPAGDDLHVRLLPGTIPGDFTKRADDLAHALGARAVRVTSPNPGWVVLTIVRRDPLEVELKLSSVKPAMDLTQVAFAVGEDGRWRYRNYANTASEVGGGVPGSGKTAGETSLACALIQNPAVQYVVLDGKGGTDWSWIEPRASIFLAEDEDLDTVADVIETVHQVMRHRLQTQKATRGDSNFWNMPIVAEHPVIVLLVDEVQTYVEEPKTMGKDKADLGKLITSRLTQMVKKGRSAGVIVKPMTQKPTGDALPTAMRDNAGIRTAWWVTSRNAAEAILGPIVNESTISPVDIGKSRPGVAVVDNGTGELERVRYPYVSETTAEHIAKTTAHLRRDLTTLGHDEQADVSVERLTTDGHPLPPAPPQLGELHAVPDHEDDTNADDTAGVA